MKPSQKIKQNVVNQIAKTTLYENVSELMKMQQIYEAGIKEHSKAGLINPARIFLRINTPSIFIFTYYILS